ncbi:hypothetical protein Sango_1162300 [Sesamum angolense]|uniref:Retrotransposon gag protein n=1 Tax=Sesamum angolense TaxID=2727404 RepID=A0AAE2BWP2_9LAMI|nr:hypothetical protein Sango_1162300 [Sesamum angolense]
MPRSSRTGELEFDPEIEKTACRIRKETKQLKGVASTSSTSKADFELDVPTSSKFGEEVMAQNSERTINEMTSPDLNQQPLCIEYPILDVDFELKSGLIHLLPTFRGLAGEDPHKHIKEFHVVTKQKIGFTPYLREPLLVGTNSRNNFFRTTSPLPEQQTSGKISVEYDKFQVKVSMSIGEDSSRGIQQVKACGICTSSGHFTDACPTLQEEPTMHANAVGGFFGPSQRGHDPFSNTYNPGWRDHPNLRYGNQPQNSQRPPYQQPPPPQTNSNLGTSIEDMMKILVANTQQFQQETRASIQNLESQVSQLASSISRLESQGKLPSQTIINPKQNVSAITMCNEKELQFENSTRCGQAQQGKIEDSIERGHVEQGKTGEEFKILPKQAEKSNITYEEHPKVFVPKHPFPERLSPKRRKRRGRFLKLYAKLRSLNIDPLKETGVVIQLADRSIVYPEGVLEDILVQVNELIFPTDFYVLDMTENTSPNSTSIFLGRPFLKTSKTKLMLMPEFSLWNLIMRL